MNNKDKNEKLSLELRKNLRKRKKSVNWHNSFTKRILSDIHLIQLDPLAKFNSTISKIYPKRY